MASTENEAGDVPTPGQSSQPQVSQEEKVAKLNQLKATATQQYALKNYSNAAEAYSEAAELQDEINGEMSIDNGDLLYQYGRCLYHVGVSKSDVLGGKVAQQEEPKKKKRKIVPDDAQEGAASASAPAEIKTETTSNGNKHDAANKPFFQITGDENFTDDEDEDEEEAEEEGDEEDDDLAIAYEILDTARVLFRRKIAAIEESAGEDKAARQEARILKERLADTHDLQAEIKLENEQFSDAVNDAREALSLKLSLYPQESGLIAEAHYKLSIALDFASLPVQSAEAGDGVEVKQEEGKVDEEMRKQAAEEMEKAILSCQARMKKEESSLAELEGAKLESMKRSIADAKDLVQDMKNRLVDLRNPPQASASSNAADLLGGDAMKGILGQMLGASKAEQTQRIAQATASANDLSGLIKQKKKPKLEESTEAEGKGKRKAEDSDQTASKKVKFEGEA